MSLACGKLMGWIQALVRHLLPQATRAITLGGENHFGQPWKVGIHRSAAERKEGAAPNSSSECPGCPAFWLGLP